MSPTDFIAWREHMGRPRGRPVSRAEAARLLGCGPNQPRIWEAGETEIPEYIGLACAALAYGLPAWRKVE